MASPEGVVGDRRVWETAFEGEKENAVGMTKEHHEEGVKDRLVDSW